MTMSTFSVEIVDDISLRDCSDIRALVGNVPQNVKMHVNDFCEYLTHQSKLHAAIITKDGRIAGASLFFIKNRGTPNSTISLYNVFSLEQGAGRLGFQAYWDYAIKHNVKWFKFYADLGAYEFYKKFGFKYFGISKTGLTLSTMGRILDPDAKVSNSLWVPDHDRYLDSNVQTFYDKHAYGSKKIPKRYKYILEESPFHDYSLVTSSLEDYFV